MYSIHDSADSAFLRSVHAFLMQNDISMICERSDYFLNCARNTGIILDEYLFSEYSPLHRHQS